MDPRQMLIDELELTVRTYNCLKNANIRSVGELVTQTERELLRSRHFGRKSLNELKEILNEMGLRLGMDDDNDDTIGVSHPNHPNPPSTQSSSVVPEQPSTDD